ncbi:MAG: stage V sporulation protein AC [Oscillospiraceae bacterium]|jgi:stage V sporulation protein AC|nr:stage V sporulation protein AC [Oscillospiraceae bacterium]
MEMTNEQYNAYVKSIAPASPLAMDMVKAFVSGGAICCVGQLILNLYLSYGLARLDAAAATSITMVLIGAALTGLGVYDKMAKFSGAGTLVPITGFANSVVAPALEFKTEGFVTGTAAKMFVIAGPVIVFGISASVVYGLVLVLFGLA